MQNIPEIDLNNPHLLNFMRDVDWEAFSKEQKWICYLRAGLGDSYKVIKQKWEDVTTQKISDEAIGTCLLRSAESIRWEKGQSGGPKHYLCFQDLDLLVDEMIERARIHDAFDTKTILQYACKLKQKRKEKVLSALEKCRCFTFLEDISKQEIKEPERSWINHILDLIDAKLQYPLLIDNVRFLTCTPDHILSFFNKFREVLLTTLPELIFTADETNMDPSLRRKAVVPAEMRSYYEGNEEAEIPHMTAMCCCNLFGEGPPIHVILKDKMFLPLELHGMPTSLFSLGATKSGWMDRYQFFGWVVCFIGWYHNYINQKGGKYKSLRGLLILDGHVSRTCPIALELLDAFNIMLLILPSHSTHILQLFDVGLASPMKTLYGQLLHRYLRDNNKRIVGNWSATVRKISLEAISEAWYKVRTMNNCLNAAREIGYFPFNPDAALHNKYVRELTERELQIVTERSSRQRNSRLNINNECLTIPSKRNGIKEELLSTRDSILCKQMSDYQSLYDLFKSIFEATREHRSPQLTKPQNFLGIDFSSMYHDWNH